MSIGAVFAKKGLSKKVKVVNCELYHFSNDLKPLMMKSKVLVLFFIACTMGKVATAQDDAITDDDLNRYAVAMDSIENMKASLIETITEMVKGNEEVSASRYNDLSKIIDDSTKLAETEATEVEIEFVKAVAAKKEEETAKINAAFQSLAIDYIGAKTYNAVKKALKEDEEIKAKYEALLAARTKDEETK